jgi:hypothetical protein
MSLLLVVVLCIGFIAGYFLSTIVLVVISGICITIGIHLMWTMREIGKIVTMLFVIYAGLANLIMWVTHYKVTHQTWFGDFLSHLLR